MYYSWHASYSRNKDVMGSIHMDVVLGILLCAYIVSIVIHLFIVIVYQLFVLVVVELYTNEKYCIINMLLNYRLYSEKK